MLRHDDISGHSANSVNTFMTRGRYVVSTKADDPLIRPARARQIWAANTAAAMQGIGVPTVLVGDVSTSPFPVESIAGVHAAKRRIAELYSVQTEFSLGLTNAKNLRTIGEWKIPYAWFTNIFPHAGLVHTRDPIIAATAAQLQINFVIEHHDEDYQRLPDIWQGLSANPNCRAVVAITDVVKDSLLDEGVAPDKVIVLDSGVNPDAALARHTEAQRWRSYFLGRNFSQLVVYCGGMQPERGISDILQAAQAMTDAMFVFCGGTDPDIARWKPVVDSLQLQNVRMLGFLPHSTMCEIQQAADTLLLSRAEDGRPGITSPLKLFEYLVTGKPIVLAKIPATERFIDSNLCLHYYEPGSVLSLIAAIRESCGKFPFGYISTANTEVGQSFTWAQRQRRLIDFIGNVDPRTTF